ncbi:hypothetical protein EV421DRAFT_780388 [Armillaria borealis]|uniref:Uncharacterized protein n=1 Tax=Armillaria borealis TaxID=47425 RepID=A0AA39JD54_9AGAR|nr:hypothetical protein EV421DRAFT_780388 [Armillaria borealis]
MLQRYPFASIPHLRYCVDITHLGPKRDNSPSQCNKHPPQRRGVVPLKPHVLDHTNVPRSYVSTLSHHQHSHSYPGYCCRILQGHLRYEEVYLFLLEGLSILRSECEHKYIANTEHHIRAAQVDYLRACQIIESRFEDLLWDSEELLVAELRGSCGFEILLHLTKRLSSYRLIVMECIPRHLSMLWDDAREFLACCNYLGEVMSRIQIRFRSPEWRSYHRTLSTYG